MIAIKDMEMPKYCTYLDEETRKWIDCPIYKSCKHRIASYIGEKPSDCPLVEIITCGHCNNHGLDREHHPDIDGARYCPTLHTYTGFDYYCGDAERREHEQL